MSEITKLQALEILDSRGNPTLAVTVTLANGVTATAKVPSGASTGKREAVELRDGDKGRYGGKGVLKARGHVESEIQSAVHGFDANDQKGLDKKLCELDGTPNKGRLGANAILGVSLAVAHAAAKDHGLPLYATLVDKPANLIPTPGLNVLNGGSHADSNVDFQEFMISPVGAPNFSEALRAASETFHTLKAVLHKKGYSTGVGDEGGFAPQLKSNEEAIELILEAIQKAGYKPGKDLVIMLDPAASEFFDEGNYIFAKSDKSKKAPSEMVALWKSWLQKYPEFGPSRTVWPRTTRRLEADTKELGNQIQLVGDDNFVTIRALPARHQGWNRERHSDQAESDRTVTETLECIQMAGSMVMARSSRIVREKPTTRALPILRLQRHGSDQDGLRLPWRAHCKVQPASGNRARVG